MQAKRVAQLAKELALDKKAEEPVVMDVRELTSVAQYFLVTHGNSDRHVRAIANHLADELEKKKVKLWHLEGMEDGRWVLLDFGDVLVHVFYKETREFYSLERLWGEAKRI